MKALAEATPDIRYYPNFSIAGALQTWVFGDRVSLIGDAAHAHGGAYATGGSIAIDDAYAFHLAISHVYPVSASEKPTVEQIGKALRLYEATRKPHVERLLSAVLEGNKTKAARAGKLTSDEELRRMAIERPDTVWLHEHDVISAFEAALTKDSQGRDNEQEKKALSPRL